jgi:hypothetical protein
MAKKATAPKTQKGSPVEPDKPKVKKALTTAQKLKKAEAALKRILNVIK